MTDKKNKALKLALEAFEADASNENFLVLKHYVSEALAEQPAQLLPFGVGGGLVAIKTLLSRDPCVHANVAIGMIEAMLAEQPAQQPYDTHAAPGQSLDTHSRMPPARKPLTDEQIGMAFRKAFPVGGVVFTNGAIDFARAIEAAHGIKGDA